ncbi:hypothetical protein GOODEAATRI_004998 [Goodea atripinnis]|uniref:Uncharacterized protein n=1 Tax=Goodea atripinnis TaxID=208336 RepID=A0ABV0P1R6_9TELE
MSAGFSGHLPERMQGTVRPGSEGFIDTDCSDTSKSGPINLLAGGGVTGACEDAAASQRCGKCFCDLCYRR